MDTLSQLLETINDTNQHDFCVEMMKRLNILRNNDNSCDVTLEVGSGEEQARLKAHRIVLSAASPFFFKALNNDMKEKKEGVIRLQETSKSVMEEVLDYFYTGHVEVRTEDNAYDLMAIADYFLLPSLKSLSGRFVLQNISTSNCILAYYSAVKYRCDELEEGARGFIHTNFVAVVKESKDFLSLDSKQVEEWISSDEIVVDGEEFVFEAILKWIERDENTRKRHFLDLFRLVRCVYTSRDYLFKEILQNRFVKDNKECMDLVHDAMRLAFHATDDSLLVQLPRNCLKAHEDAIVACGGKKALCYIPSHNKWYELPAMLSERGRGHGVCTCQGKLYVVGGHKKGNSVAERYDPSVNCWAPIAPPKDVVRLAAVVTFQGFVYAIGGTCSIYHERLSTVQRYNPDTNTWQVMAPLSGVRSSVCAVADGNHLYAIGGTTGKEFLTTVERFDSKTQSWSEIASTLEKRVAACGASVNGKVFVFGGCCNFQTQEITNSCEMYDPVTEAWSNIASTTLRRSDAGAVSFQGNIVVFGGTVTEESLLEVYDVERNEWKTWTRLKSVCEEMKISSLRMLKAFLVDETTPPPDP